MGAEQKANNESALEIIYTVMKDGGLDPQGFEQGAGFVTDLDDDLYAGAIVHFLEDQEQFVLFVEFRKRASKETRDQVVEFILRANWWLVIGSFDLDLDSGAIRFRSGVDFEGTELSYELVRNVLVTTRISTEQWGPALVDVLEGKKSAAEAIAEVEAAMDA